VLFGISVEPWMMMWGGVFLGVLVAFQMLGGLRIIKLKGKLHLKVHRGVAWAIFLGGLAHGVMGFAYFGRI